MKNKIFVTLFLVVTLSLACRKKGAKPNWEIDSLLPLFETSLSIADIAGKDFVKNNPDNSVSVVFKENFYDLNIDSLVQIPDTIITEQLNIPFNMNASPGATFYSSNETTKYNLGQVELNKAIIESGVAEIEFVSSVQEKTIITYSLPCATKNGTILELTEYVPKPPLNGSVTIKKTIDLSGYTIDLRSPTFNNVNTIYTQVNAKVDPTADGPVTVGPSTILKVKNHFKDIVPYYVKGYFGKHNMAFGPEQNTFNGLQNIISGTVDLEDVIVKINIHNAFGIDAKAKITQLASINNKNSTQVNLNHTIIGNTIFINRATEINGNPPVQYTYFSELLNAQNSNTDAMLEIIPDAFLYGLNMDINPLGNVSNGNDFMFKKYALEATLEIEVPLSFKSNTLTIQNISPIHITYKENETKLNEGTFLLFAENGFPMETQLILELMDQNNKILSEIPIDKVIPAAPVNNSFVVTEPVKEKIAIRLNKENTDLLYKAEKIRVKASFTTIPKSSFIKIYNHYQLKLQMVADANMHVFLK
ncbi:MAG: hypothetical protein HND27_06610 [Bacteroidetes bacterium]|nr:hypothetical protein [Bacteroidota bacterium]MBV6460123.1 hypothetical protein [Flavobacteriales bacterium]WKZ73994.1 MAG: hypothetical protein QY303_07495 [Vicingaceae bacterium]MCL4816473.1 hypothetical protein [Flavobacteriales bacterium]NOG95436.1 hypothetical protein [Bacteroidota bacterium]